MRVSTSMIYQQLNDRMIDNSAAMSKLQGTLATGLKYTRPSEAADLVGRVQAVEGRLATLDADRQAITRVRVGVDAQSRALQLAAELMDRLKELAFQGANDPLPEEQRLALAEEVSAIKRGLVDLANTRDADDRYVFAGTQSGTPPYVLNNDGSVNYVGATTPLRVRINDVGYEDAAIPGTTAWTGIERGSQAISFFGVVKQLEDALRDDFLDGRKNSLRDIEEIGGKVGVSQARIGGIQQRLDIGERQAEEIALRAKESLSELKDLDYATALSDLKKQEMLMEASQTLMARLSQLSLLDSLR